MKEQFLLVKKNYDIKEFEKKIFEFKKEFIKYIDENI